MTASINDKARSTGGLIAYTSKPKLVRAAVVAILGLGSIAGLQGYRMGLQAQHAPNEDQVRMVLYSACRNARGYDASAPTGTPNRCNRRTIDLALAAAYSGVYEAPTDAETYEGQLDKYWRGRQSVNK